MVAVRGMIERHSYLSGASPQRPIEPVRSLMEEAIAGNRMPEVDPLLTCPDCGKQHDGEHGHGLLKVNKVCADCYELRRGKGIRRAAGYKREIARLREGYRRILALDEYDFYRKDMAREIAKTMLEGDRERT